MRHVSEDGAHPDSRRSRPARVLLKRIFALFYGYRSRFMLGFLCVFVNTCLMVGLPLVFRAIIDKGIVPKNTELLFFLAFAYLFMLLFRGTLEYLQNILVGFMGITIINDLKKKLLAHVLSLSIRFFDTNKPGKLISRIESDAQQLYMFFSDVGLKLLWAFLNITISFGVMFAIDVRLTLYILAVSPIFLVGAYLVFNWMRPMFKQERKNYSEISGFLGEHLQAIPLLRNLNNLEWSQKRFHQICHQKYSYSLKIETLETVIWFFMMVAPILAITLVLYAGAYRVASKEMTIGTVWMFVQYVQAAIWPLILISEQIREVQKALGAADRIFDLWDTPIEVKDPDQPREMLPFREAIRFENVSFAYDPEKPVLKNVSFSIEKGTTVALVGATGSGKTTTISLLARWYDPSSGTITLDGIDLRAYRQQDLIRKMSFVLQDIFLFPGTISENLRALRSDITEEQVRNASEQMGADPIIQRFSKGYDTVLKEQGKNLSFGERQLLSFSRALTFEPEILVIDEATSSVDPHTEQQIQESLYRLLEGRTAVVIAHRLSTIIHADKILVMDQGQLVEEGNHLELLQKNGHYAKLYQLQLGEESHAHVF